MFSFAIGTVAFVGGSVASLHYLGYSIPGALGVVVALFIGYQVAK
jgi:hypothetical protein